VLLLHFLTPTKEDTNLPRPSYQLISEHSYAYRYQKLKRAPATAVMLLLTHFTQELLGSIRVTMLLGIAARRHPFLSFLGST